MPTSGLQLGGQQLYSLMATLFPWLLKKQGLSESYPFAVFQRIFSESLESLDLLRRSSSFQAFS